MLLKPCSVALFKIYKAAQNDRNIETMVFFLGKSILSFLLVNGTKPPLYRFMEHLYNTNSYMLHVFNSIHYPSSSSTSHYFSSELLRLHLLLLLGTMKKKKTIPTLGYYTFTSLDCDLRASASCTV